MPRLRNPRTGVVVNVDDGTASRLRWPAAGTAKVPAATTPSDDSPPTCPDCGFVAKTTGGLAAHARTHDS